MPHPDSIPPEIEGVLARELSAIRRELNESRREQAGFMEHLRSVDSRLSNIESYQRELERRQWEESTGRHELDHIHGRDIARAQLEAREAKLRALKTGGGAGVLGAGLLTALVELIRLVRG